MEQTVNINTNLRGGVFLKRILYKMPLAKDLLSSVRYFYKVRKSLISTDFINRGIGRPIKDIIGVGNAVAIGEGSHADGLRIRIRGNNNKLTIGEKCVFGKSCSIWMEGNDIEIEIGDANTFTMICHLNAQEDKSKITIGNDCMFSNNIIIRTSDSHPIYDKNTRSRINPADPVTIGDHIWVAPNTKIMKGAKIPNGCIIGSDTTVSKEFKEENSLIVGRPARIVRENIEWTRERLF